MTRPGLNSALLGYWRTLKVVMYCRKPTTLAELRQKVKMHEQEFHWRLWPISCSPYISIFTNPSARAGYDPRSIFFKAEFNRFEIRVFLLLDSLPHQGSHSLPYYLPIAGGRIIGEYLFTVYIKVKKLKTITNESSKINCIYLFMYE